MRRICRYNICFLQQLHAFRTPKIAVALKDSQAPADSVLQNIFSVKQICSPVAVVILHALDYSAIRLAARSRSLIVKKR